MEQHSPPAREAVRVVIPPQRPPASGGRATSQRALVEASLLRCQEQLDRSRRT
jgi:hypothetical protein